MSFVDDFKDYLTEENTLIAITVLVIFTTTLIYFYTRYSLKKPQTQKIDDKMILKEIFKVHNGINWEPKYKENWGKDDCNLSEWSGIETGFSNGNEHVLELIMRGNRNFLGLFSFLFFFIDILLILIRICCFCSSFSCSSFLVVIIVRYIS